MPVVAQVPPSLVFCLVLNFHLSAICWASRPHLWHVRGHHNPPLPLAADCNLTYLSYAQADLIKETCLQTMCWNVITVGETAHLEIFFSGPLDSINDVIISMQHYLYVLVTGGGFPRWLFFMAFLTGLFWWTPCLPLRTNVYLRLKTAFCSLRVAQHKQASVRIRLIILIWLRLCAYNNSEHWSGSLL